MILFQTKLQITEAASRPHVNYLLWFESVERRYQV